MATRMKRGVSKVSKRGSAKETAIKAGNSAAKGNEGVMEDFITDLGTALWERGVTADEVKSNFAYIPRDLCSLCIKCALGSVHNERRPFRLFFTADVLPMQTEAIARALRVTISTLSPGELRDILQGCDLGDVASRLEAVIRDAAQAGNQDNRDRNESKALLKKRRTVDNIDKNDCNDILLLAMDESLKKEIEESMQQIQKQAAKLKTMTPDPMSLLLSRNPPPQGYVDWLLDNIISSNNESQSLGSFETGLRLCNALAGHVESRDMAIATFKPLVLRLQRALDSIMLEKSPKHMGPTYQIQIQSFLAQLLACMHLIIKEKEKGKTGDNEDGERSMNWLAWTSKRQDTDVFPYQEAAETCFLLVFLRCKASLYLKGQSPKNSSVGSNARHDFQLLSPLAAIGYLRHAQDISLEQIQSMSDIEKQCFVASYTALPRGTVTDTGTVGEADGLAMEHIYFQMLLAARKAAVIATALGNMVLSTQILTEAAATVAPSQAVDWLNVQPPSSAVTEAITSLEFGPQNLSSHLIYTASERVTQAFAVASASSLNGEGDGSGGGGGGDAVSDLLYYVSTEGDASMFGRQWGDDSDDEDDDEDEDDGHDATYKIGHPGIDLDRLESQEARGDDFEDDDFEDEED